MENKNKSKYKDRCLNPMDAIADWKARVSDIIESNKDCQIAEFYINPDDATATNAFVVSLSRLKTYTTHKYKISLSARMFSLKKSIIIPAHFEAFVESSPDANDIYRRAAFFFSDTVLGMTDLLRRIKLEDLTTYCAKRSTFQNKMIRNYSNEFADYDAVPDQSEISRRFYRMTYEYYDKWRNNNFYGNNEMSDCAMSVISANYGNGSEIITNAKGVRISRIICVNLKYGGEISDDDINGDKMSYGDFPWPTACSYCKPNASWVTITAGIFQIFNEQADSGCSVEECAEKKAAYYFGRCPDNPMAKRIIAIGKAINREFESAVAKAAEKADIICPEATMADPDGNAGIYALRVDPSSDERKLISVNPEYSDGVEISKVIRAGMGTNLQYAIPAGCISSEDFMKIIEKDFDAYRFGDLPEKSFAKANGSWASIRSMMFIRKGMLPKIHLKVSKEYIDKSKKNNSLDIRVMLGDHQFATSYISIDSKGMKEMAKESEFLRSYGVDTSALDEFILEKRL